MIDLNHITLKYSNGKGIFDINFRVNQGEIMGYIGSNGAGKTTTIRCLLGFTPPDIGICSINNLDCFKSATKIQNNLGYIAGEIAFPDGMKGEEFLNFICRMRKTTDFSLRKDLIDMFELDTKGAVKKYSKGMKQKIAIITAFMHNPDILILDEPTSGLDPLMQNRFVELILKEKNKGKTILMSSHIFEEVDKTCDKIIIIKNGQIVVNSDIENLKSSQRKAFVVESNEIDKILNMPYSINLMGDNIAEVTVIASQTDKFIKDISQFNISSLDIKTQNLEDIFLDYYKR